MYMQPIVRAKPPASLLRRRVVGSALLIAGGAVMMLWLVLCSGIALVTFGARGLVALPRTLIQAVDHAGDHAFGL